MVWTQELVSVNVREGWSSRLVNSWERQLMVVTDVSTASAVVETFMNINSDQPSITLINLHEH